MSLEPLELERHLYSLLRHILQLCAIDAATKTIAGQRWARALIGIVLPPVSSTWETGALLIFLNA